MSAKKSKGGPEASPRLFLKLFGQSILGRKRKIAATVLNIIISSVSDAEMKRVARKASKHKLGKKADAAKREKLRERYLKQLRAMRKRSRKNGNPIIEKIED